MQDHTDVAIAQIQELQRKVGDVIRGIQDISRDGHIDNAVSELRCLVRWLRVVCDDPYPTMPGPDTVHELTFDMANRLEMITGIILRAKSTYDYDAEARQIEENRRAHRERVQREMQS